MNIFWGCWFCTTSAYRNSLYGECIRRTANLHFWGQPASEEGKECEWKTKRCTYGAIKYSFEYFVFKKEKKKIRAAFTKLPLSYRIDHNNTVLKIYTHKTGANREQRQHAEKNILFSDFMLSPLCWKQNTPVMVFISPVVLFTTIIRLAV